MVQHQTESDIISLNNAISDSSDLSEDDHNRLINHHSTDNKMIVMHDVMKPGTSRLEDSGAIIEMQDDANELHQQYATETDDDGDHYSSDSWEDSISSGCEVFNDHNLHNQDKNYAFNNDRFSHIPQTFGTIEKKTFLEELRLWAIKHKISFVALADLLRILIMYVIQLSFLPKDPRTLLRTPRNTNIIELAGGSYWHYGLNNIIENLKKEYTKLKVAVNEFQLILNVDGLPLSKSSKSTFWPILVSDKILENVYMVGCYYGKEHPTDSNRFLQTFINELIDFNQRSQLN